MPIRQKKVYNRPRKIYDKAIIIEENGLIKKYGLKNRREIWKADFAIQKIRNIAKSLITGEEKRREEFIEKQKKSGFPVNSISDILALNKEDYLKRRLQSVIVARGITRTYKAARQLITHKHIKVGKKCINAPSHLTTLEEENNISSNITFSKEIISSKEKKILAQIKPKEDKEND
jgi:small subunit ribosomal protein S4